MRELRFEGLSQDGTRVLLAGKDGQKWSLVIDDRLVAAIRQDRARISQIELQQAGALRPREIQARIRAGATAEDVAASSGLPVAHIRRYEGPVLSERAWVAHQAQGTEVRRPGGDIPLRDLVAERLADHGVEPELIGWDAWRRDDGLWVVIATFPLGPNTLVATWTYDTAGRTMTVADDNARQLSSASAEAALHLASARPSLAAISDDGPEARVIDLARPGSRHADPLSGAGIRDVTHHRDAEDDLFADPPFADADADADAALESEAASLEPARAEAEDALAEDALAEDALAEDALADDGEHPTDSTDEPEGLDADEHEPEQEHELPSGLAALFEAPAPTRRPSKPAVPSFDDILFGPGPR